jgi:glutamate-1-semialdehyde 2,1-aminomutase
MSTGPQLYQAAKQLIPGGTQLLSKRPEMFLPDQWPAYYSRAKGCEVWDLDGRRYIDMTSSGIGSCLLGFADDDVDAAVRRQIDDGGMCTLNSPVEVQLARLLLSIHPWADMARFCRTGGEAMAVAVRIARAATGRDGVAICGYHGWSDWYLAANLGQDAALDGHLLPGLRPAGVPRPLRDTAATFHFNRVEELEILVAARGPQLAAIVLEPARFHLPAPGFLERIRELADACGAVVVLDEISAGWRQNLGGLHLKLGFEPDVAVFAKAMSNGYPMAAIVGRRGVMKAAEESFISSTYWTESLGPTAALACIEKMRRVQVWDHVAAAGARVQEGWLAAATRAGLDIAVEGFYALSHFSLNYKAERQAIRTLLTQLMLDRGYLATDTFYPSLAHIPAVIDAYLETFGEVLGLLVGAIEAGTVRSQLRGPVAHDGFRRLT